MFLGIVMLHIYCIYNFGTRNIISNFLTFGILTFVFFKVCVQYLIWLFSLIPWLLASTLIF